MSRTRTSPGDRTDLDPVFRAIADPKRRRMLDLLRDGPCTTSELVGSFPEVSRYAVMKHLKSLHEADLIVVRYEGSTRINSINPVPIRAIHDRWLAGFAPLWGASLGRLRDLAEEDRDR